MVSFFNVHSFFHPAPRSAEGRLQGKNPAPKIGVGRIAWAAPRVLVALALTVLYRIMLLMLFTLFLIGNHSPRPLKGVGRCYTCTFLCFLCFPCDSILCQ